MMELHYILTKICFSLSRNILFIGYFECSNIFLRTMTQIFHMMVYYIWNVFPKFPMIAALFVLRWFFF